VNETIIFPANRRAFGEENLMGGKGRSLPAPPKGSTPKMFEGERGRQWARKNEVFEAEGRALKTRFINSSPTILGGERGSVWSGWRAKRESVEDRGKKAAFSFS